MTRAAPPRSPPRPVTAEQIAAVLDSLRAGVALDRACRAARVSPDALAALAKLDDGVAESIEEAQAEGGASDDTTAQDGTLDHRRIAREAARLAPGPLGFLLWVDARCEEHGHHVMSPWWRYALAEFYSADKRWLVVCAGRGSGKSTTLERVAVADGMFTARIVPPGQRWVWPFISVSTPDAHKRIAGLVAIFQAIGLAPVVRRAPVPSIELDDARGNAIGFVALASTIAGVSGPSTIGVTVDEESKLRNKQTHANPSREILASLAQTFRARPGIRAIRCSSAWTTEGTHPESIAEGDTEINHVARLGDAFVSAAVDGLLEVAAWEAARGNPVGAATIRAHAATVTAASTGIPTWVANPTISALASRREADGLAVGGPISATDVWLRENASVPHAAGVRVGAGVDQLDGLAEANRKLCASTRGGFDWGQRWPGLAPGDPRGETVPGLARRRTL